MAYASPRPLVHTQKRGVHQKLCTPPAMAYYFSGGLFVNTIYKDRELIGQQSEDNPWLWLQY